MQQVSLFYQIMIKGVYVLLIRMYECSIQVGVLGTVPFIRGWYAYVGSAFGTGGFARVKRHIRSDKTKSANVHWHIDYLLTSPFGSLERVYCLKTEKKIECMVAAAIGGSGILGFGSSDCSCISHLFHFSTDPSDSLLNILSNPDWGELVTYNTD